VGYAPDTDFFTATSSGPVFGGLVAAACAALLGPAWAAGATFVEIGAERPGEGVLAGVPHPFAGARTVRLGDPVALEGPCVVFSNELFDAQPCRRFAFRAGRWRELGVELRDGALAEAEVGGPEAGVAALLPASPPEGAVVDAPLAAVALLERIAGQPWTGLFVACDYGKSWAELSEGCPGGTLRAYHRHRQSNAVLERPGEQDLTCHVCWDWLAAALERRGFASPSLESQEAFFVRHAPGFIAAASQAGASRFSREKQSLMQLLHPAHMGRKFQVLHAARIS